MFRDVNDFGMLCGSVKDLEHYIDFYGTTAPTNIAAVFEDGKIVIFPKEYFYPYGFREKYSPDCIKENTYGIHWWNDSWSSLKARLFLEAKHLSGVKKLMKRARIIARYYLKEKRK